MLHWFNDDNEYYMDYENDPPEEIQEFESDGEFNGEEEKVGKKCHVGPFLCKICNGKSKVRLFCFLKHSYQF